MGDITIPDGAVLEPGSKQKKQWRLKNSGACAWVGCRVRELARETPLGGVPHVDVLLCSRCVSLPPPPTFIARCMPSSVDFGVVCPAGKQPGAFGNELVLLDVPQTAIGKEVPTMLRSHASHLHSVTQLLVRDSGDCDG
jgi:hypothetical protein